MKTRSHFFPRQRSGSTLAMVMVFSAVSFLILGAALSWCMTNAKLNERNNQYFTTVAASEAATEKVLASMRQDYQSQGESIVWARRDAYRRLVPTPAENPAWARFAFNDNLGHAHHTYVER